MTPTRKILAWLFHLACIGHAPPSGPGDLADVEFSEASPTADRLLGRLAPHVELRGKTVLDLGCGSGSTAIALGQKGAARVLGVDIRPVELARGMLETEYAGLAGTVEFRQIAADGSGLDDERFDVVVSKDAFEHVSDPARHVRVIEDHVVDGGDVVIAFGPLWKSPWGSHLGFMTSVPWVHLVFPEEIMLAERLRFRPWEGEISRLDDVPGGLNRMTLARFESVMAASGLECLSFEVDSVGSGRGGRLGKAVTFASRRPRLREYFAGYVFSLWRPRDRPV